MADRGVLCTTSSITRLVQGRYFGGALRWSVSIITIGPSQWARPVFCCASGACRGHGWLLREQVSACSTPEAAHHPNQDHKQATTQSNNT